MTAGSVPSAGLLHDGEVTTTTVRSKLDDDDDFEEKPVSPPTDILKQGMTITLDYLRRIFESRRTCSDAFPPCIAMTSGPGPFTFDGTKHSPIESCCSAASSRGCAVLHEGGLSPSFSLQNRKKKSLEDAVVIHTDASHCERSPHYDIALRISLSSVPLGLPLWASLSAFSHLVIHTLMN